MTLKIKNTQEITWIRSKTDKNKSFIELLISILSYDIKDYWLIDWPIIFISSFSDKPQQM